MATSNALEVGRNSSDSALATAQAQAVAIQATLQSAVATATVLSEQAANNGIDGDFTQVEVQIDGQGLLDGASDATQSASKAIAAALKPYARCPEQAEMEIATKNLAIEYGRCVILRFRSGGDCHGIQGV